MSCKLSSMNNSIKLNNDPHNWTKTASIDSNVKLAGEEAKDRLYEPKHKKKLVRVLTVVAYVFFVSLAAIMLSLYYVFLWNGNQKDNVMKESVKMVQQTGQVGHSLCNNGENVLVDVPYEPTAIPVREATTPGVPEADEQDSWPEFQGNFTAETLEIKSPLIQKLIFKNALD